MKYPIILLVFAITATAGPLDKTGEGGISGTGKGGISGTGKLGEKKTVGEKATVRIVPKVNATMIQQTPAAWLDKKNLIVHAAPYSIKRHQSGWEGRTAGLTIYLTDEAKRYYESSSSHKVTPVFSGEVRRDSTGHPALYLSRGLNYAK